MEQRAKTRETRAPHLDHALEDPQQIGKLGIEFHDGPRDDLANPSFKMGR